MGTLSVVLGEPICPRCLRPIMWNQDAVESLAGFLHVSCHASAELDRRPAGAA